MSVSLWAYTESCEGRPCPGDCDNCGRAEDEEETGKWVHDGSRWTNRWLCSRCGKKLFGERTPFCQYCGAKMEVQDE